MCKRLLLLTGWCVVTSVGIVMGDCPLPPHPSHGRHEPPGGDCGGAGQHPACDGNPGTLAPEDWLLTVVCDFGYQNSDPKHADVPSVCSNGLWSIPHLPSCVIPTDLGLNDQERCIVPYPPPNSEIHLLDFECGGGDHSPGSVVPRKCILVLNCSPGYSRRVDTGDFLSVCTNKTWHPNIPDDFCIKTNGGTPTKPEVRPTKAPVSLAPLPLAETPTGCLLPDTTSTRKFCSQEKGCEDCDFHLSSCHKLPGSKLTKVKVVCEPGYTTEGARTSAAAICLEARGEWFPPIPKCRKLCPPLISEELDLTCVYNNDPVSCFKSAAPGTKVTVKCKPNFVEIEYFAKLGAYRDVIFCRSSGVWSQNLPLCKPECGLSKEKAQDYVATVVDGKAAKVGFFPWHAGLYSRKEEDGKTLWDQICGGSLISKWIVLTAAHCVHDSQASDLQIALGKYHRSWDIQEVAEQKRKVTDIISHHAYNPTTKTSDIALLRMNKKITYGEFIMPVCVGLPIGWDQILDAMLYVVGWGKVGIGAQSSEILLYNKIQLLPEKQCKLELPFYSASLVLEKLCALTNNSVSTTQQGDSGGGLTALYKDGYHSRHFIVGIVSAKFKETALFTNVTSYEDWRKSHIRLLDTNYDS